MCIFNSDTAEEPNFCFTCTVCIGKKSLIYILNYYVKMFLGRNQILNCQQSLLPDFFLQVTYSTLSIMEGLWK